MDAKSFIANSEIVDGPSKFDLSVALFAEISGEQKLLTFATARSGEFHDSMTVVVNTVSREDGSGESWIIEGRILRVKNHPKLPVDLRGFRCWYRTDRRKGVMSLQF